MLDSSWEQRGGQNKKGKVKQIREGQGGQQTAPSFKQVDKPEGSTGGPSDPSPGEPDPTRWGMSLSSAVNVVLLMREDMSL